MSRRETAWFSTLLLVAAALYLWNLPLNGWGNGYYAAAAQAGASNWTAFFFGSSDGGNGITVDKLPGSIWVASLSVRLFGLSSWSLLVPQALMGIGTVALTYLIVRRHFKANTALLSGVVLLLTPAAAIMFRYNNPDALLTFLLTLAVYLTLRAAEDGRWRWILLAAVAIGIGFLAKSAQALLLLPTLGLVFMYAGPGRMRKRIVQLATAFLVVVLVAGSWVAIAESTRAADRPYAGGSFGNSFVEVLLRQNGLGRILGAGAGGTAGNELLRPGALRLLVYPSFGSQGSWLIPIALTALLCSLVLLRRAVRSDPRRALVLLAGGWFLTYAATFSFMNGVIHPYYLVTIAPPIAVLVAVGWQLVWPARRWLQFRLAMAASVLAAAVFAFGYLINGAGAGPALGILVVVASLIGCELMVFRIRKRRISRFTAVTAAIVCFVGPIAFTVSAVQARHTGALPSATLPGSPTVLDSPDPSQWPETSSRALRGSALGHAAEPAVVSELKLHASRHRWAAAAPGAINAGNYQLAASLPVLPVGGFNGGTPFPTLEQFQEFISSGQLKYFISHRDGTDISAEAGFANEISTWVRENYKPQLYGDTELFDLSGPPEDA
ncbi:4-amino-4-deoxy-L-arabinose transferase-like glycosyltransferase [Arthrobacter sp. PvP102]|uniref:glycosyltransferase family 39 protein n=1 Tax=unclassified Arthrobacter TaxID=235627 RepID=UPI001AEAC306|nr:MULTISPECIES: glycosyltransferase family 39 protein [unclassified Arthrobacter]MBP1232230.1 4-amino-4-deoxy-L-arabinose transferase-like glycosyltransferase [Arthrobacter sp. PvP103]MBP1237365.1 4-amino-4-deoxy-L-arabinose transferase-like glycosyltransferase [Arthrobacter sp. PvP102]